MLLERRTNVPEQDQEAVHKQARLDRTLAEFRAFCQDVDDWAAYRSAQDGQRQHWSQLEALRKTLNGAADALAGRIAKTSLEEQSVESVYEACADHELRIGWLQRLWKYFRERFDQRDDEQLLKVLDAADDVTWSCYCDVMDRARDHANVVRGPSPLPFLEFEYSPAATAADSIPEELRRDGKFLLPFLRRLPVPVIHLPAATLRNPWWLVYIGHEVGHHLMADLGIAKGFAAAVSEKVSGGPVQTPYGKLWEDWAPEVFADVASVMLMGSAAVGAVLEFERAGPDQMRRRRTSYPPAAVRLELLARCADELGLDGRLQLGGLDAKALVKGDVDAERDLAALDDVLPVALGPLALPGVPAIPLATLVGFDASLVGKAPDLANEPVNLATARRLASATFRSWQGVAATADDAARQSAALLLGEKMLETLRTNKYPGFRSRADEKPTPADLAESLADVLLGAKPADLEGSRTAG